MQVNTRAVHDGRVAQMIDLSRQLERVQTQIATGKRLASPDEDPVAASRAAMLERALGAAQAARVAIDRAASRLAATDTALDGAGAVFERVRELALAGNNATLNPADRSTLASEVAALGEQLLSLANRTGSDGLALLGGAQPAGPAYAPDATGRIVWQRAGTAPALALDRGRIAGGVSGPAAFEGLDDGSGTPTDAFALLTALGAALSDPDPVRRAAGLAQALTGIEAATARIADVRADVGARLARLDDETAQIERLDLGREAELDAAQGVDMTAAIARLQRLSTVLEAAQAAFVRAGSLSLWEALR